MNSIESLKMDSKKKEIKENATSTDSFNTEIKLRYCTVRTSSDFGGLGFILRNKRQTLGATITSIDSGSPAELAGLKAGDRIIEVNGEVITHLDHQQVVERIKHIPDEVSLLVIDEASRDFALQNNVIAFYKDPRWSPDDASTLDPKNFKNRKLATKLAKSCQQTRELKKEIMKHKCEIEEEKEKNKTLKGDLDNLKSELEASKQQPVSQIASRPANPGMKRWVIFWRLFSITSIWKTLTNMMGNKAAQKNTSGHWQLLSKRSNTSTQETWTQTTPEWTPLFDVKGTIFEDVNVDLVGHLDFRDFEKNFDCFVETTEDQPKRISPIAQDCENNMQLNPHWKWNLLVILKIVGKSTEEMFQAINTCDINSLSSNHLEQLSKYIPSELEVKTIIQNQCICENSEVEQLVTKLAQMEDLDSKFDTLFHFGKLHQDLNHIRLNIKHLHDSAISLKENEKLRNILQIIATYGNYMNSGKATCSLGFKMEFLHQFMEIKGKDGKTFMQFLVNLLVNKCPWLIDFYLDLHLNVERRDFFHTIATGMQQLKEDLRLVLQKSKSQDEKCTFQVLLSQSQTEIEQLVESYDNLAAVHREVCNMFGENYCSTDSCSIFVIINEFMKNFKKSVTGYKSNERKSDAPSTEGKATLSPWMATNPFLYKQTAKCPISFEGRPPSADHKMLPDPKSVTPVNSTGRNLLSPVALDWRMPLPKGDDPEHQKDKTPSNQMRGPILENPEFLRSPGLEWLQRIEALVVKDNAKQPTDKVVAENDVDSSFDSTRWDSPFDDKVTEFWMMDDASPLPEFKLAHDSSDDFSFDSVQRPTPLSEDSAVEFWMMDIASPSPEGKPSPKISFLSFDSTHDGNPHPEQLATPLQLTNDDVHDGISRKEQYGPVLVLSSSAAAESPCECPCIHDDELAKVVQEGIAPQEASNSSNVPEDHEGSVSQYHTSSLSIGTPSKWFQKDDNDNFILFEELEDPTIVNPNSNKGDYSCIAQSSILLEFHPDTTSSQQVDNSVHSKGVPLTSPVFNDRAYLTEDVQFAVHGQPMSTPSLDYDVNLASVLAEETTIFSSASDKCELEIEDEALSDEDNALLGQPILLPLFDCTVNQEVVSTSDKDNALHHDPHHDDCPTEEIQMLYPEVVCPSVHDGMALLHFSDDDPIDSAEIDESGLPEDHETVILNNFKANLSDGRNSHSVCITENDHASQKSGSRSEEHDATGLLDNSDNAGENVSETSPKGALGFHPDVSTSDFRDALVHLLAKTLHPSEFPSSDVQGTTGNEEKTFPDSPVDAKSAEDTMFNPANEVNPEGADCSNSHEDCINQNSVEVFQTDIHSAFVSSSFCSDKIDSVEEGTSGHTEDAVDKNVKLNDSTEIIPLNLAENSKGSEMWTDDMNYSFASIGLSESSDISGMGSPQSSNSPVEKVSKENSNHPEMLADLSTGDKYIIGTGAAFRSADTETAIYTKPSSLLGHHRSDEQAADTPLSCLPEEEDIFPRIYVSYHFHVFACKGPSRSSIKAKNPSLPMKTANSEDFLGDRPLSISPASILSSAADLEQSSPGLSPEPGRISTPSSLISDQLSSNKVSVSGRRQVEFSPVSESGDGVECHSENNYADVQMASLFGRAC